MSAIYHLVFFNPLYNLLILILWVLPSSDAGLAVIILTVLVRLIIFPLSKKAIVTQVKMAEIGPDLQRIKEEYKNPEEQARKTLELYRDKQVNPFSGIFVIIIQIPIIIALYRIFLHAGFPQIDPSILYSFVKAPEIIHTHFLGLFNITEKSAVLALLAAVTTYIQLKIVSSKQNAPQGNSFGDNLARSMQTQMKYFFPVLVFFIAYKISGVIALYWLTTNLFTIGQEIYVRKKLRNPTLVSTPTN
jgi:YidC/Oxa1 family membrane protein insertase